LRKQVAYADLNTWLKEIFMETKGNRLEKEMEAIRFLVEAGNVVSVFGKADVDFVRPDLAISDVEWAEIRDRLNNLKPGEDFNIGDETFEDLLDDIRDEQLEAS
jgi:hypothetical protein